MWKNTSKIAGDGETPKLWPESGEMTEKLSGERRQIPLEAPPQFNQSILESSLYTNTLKTGTKYTRLQILCTYYQGFSQM